MIDHFLGRPDAKYRKYQILAVLLAWSGLILYKPHGPLKRLSALLSRRLTAWQIVVLAYMTEYARRNFARIVGLHSPEPLANKYNRDYFRATWVTTALDAGFWTAMRLRPKPVRDLASVLFSVYYLFAADAADDKVRRVRGMIGVEHMRVSWNKGATPYIAFFGNLMRPKHLRIRHNPRTIKIPRPHGSMYREPISAWFYFDGPLSELKNHDKVILDIPGGGFVAMNPRCHDDKLMAWAAKTGLPVVSLDYGKAPEYPYPYALHECFDAYYSIYQSGGTCVGLGKGTPKVIVSGDSAGGNLATGLTLLLVQHQLEGLEHIPVSMRMELPLPEALVLIYPALDVNITSWLTDEQAALIEEPARRKVNQALMRRQTEDYHRLASTPVPSEDVLEHAGLKMTSTKAESKTGKPLTASPDSQSPHREPKKKADSAIAPPSGLVVQTRKQDVGPTKPRPLRTKVKTTSMISYVDDRILTPELLRGMIFLYIGEKNGPDFATDFLLSPLRAPEQYLREFPKVYMLTGEKDPLCDDTAIFAGRLRAAHLHQFQTRKEMGMVAEREQFDDSKHIHVEFIPGVSHGFLQFASVYPPAWDYMEMCSRWMKAAFAEASKRREEADEEAGGDDYFSQMRKNSSFAWDKQGGMTSNDASDNEDLALEMTSLSQPHVLRHHKRRGSGSGLGGGSSSNPDDKRHRRSRGAVKRPFDGRLSPVDTRKSLNLHHLQLTTPDSLLERRMDGVATGLMGDESRPHTPL